MSSSDMKITLQVLALIFMPILVVIVAIAVICILLRLLYGPIPFPKVKPRNRSRVIGSTDGFQYETLRHSQLDAESPADLKNITWKMTLKRTQVNDGSNNPTGGVNSDEPNYNNVASPSLQHANSSCFHFNDGRLHVHDNISFSALKSKEAPLVHSPISENIHHQVPPCSPSHLVHSAGEKEAVYDKPSPIPISVRYPVTTSSPDPIYDVPPPCPVPVCQSLNSRIHLPSQFNTWEETNQAVVYSHLPPHPPSAIRGGDLLKVRQAAIHNKTSAVEGSQ